MKKLTAIFIVFILILCACDNLQEYNPVIGNDSSNESKVVVIPIDNEKILKYYDYFAENFAIIDMLYYGTGGEFSDVNEISDEHLIVFSSLKTKPKFFENGYAYWDRDEFENEIKKSFGRELKDISTQGISTYIPGEDVFKSTGFSFNECYVIKIIDLTETDNGIFTGIFDVYGVMDILLEQIEPFDFREEILKENSKVLALANKNTIIIRFIEKYDENENMYLQFVSAQEKN